MKHVLLMVFGLLAPAQDNPRVKELIEQLRDDAIDVREGAAEALEELGPAAIPGLQELRSSPDAELRGRAEGILKAIGEQATLKKHWRKGARITAEYAGAPVATVLGDLARMASDTFVYDAAELSDPVTMRLQGATMWESLHTLSRAAPALTWTIENDALVFAKKRRPPYPSRLMGEFAVWLDGMTLTREYDFTGNPRASFTVGLVSAWERGIAPVSIDQRLTELLDDAGNNLLPPDRPGYQMRNDAVKGRMRREDVRSYLPAGMDNLKRIASVKGYALFTFPRAYEDMLLELSQPSAAARLDRFTVALRNFRNLKNACSFELLVTTPVGPGEGLTERISAQNVVVLDDQGGEHRPSSSSRSLSFSGSSFTTHESLQVGLPEGRNASKVRLRLLKEVLEKRVAFEFTDIPLE